MTPQRQKQVLAVLLIALVAVTVRTVMKVGSGGSSDRLGSGSVIRPLAWGGGESASGVEIVDLRLGDLAQKPGEFQPGRDPFRFKPAPRPPAPPPPPRPVVAPKPAVQRPVEPAKPRPPEPTFVFLGSFGPEKKRVAVFSDSAEIFNVVEGDVFKEAFVVRKIGYESADVGWVNFPNEPARRLAAGG